MPDVSRTSSAPDRRGATALIVFTTVVLLILIYRETPHLNGSPYWVWSYRHLDVARVGVALGCGAIPFFLARWAVTRGLSIRWALPVVASATFALQLAAIGLMDAPFGFGEIIDIIRSEAATSYFSDAEKSIADGVSVREFISTFPDRMPNLGGHNRNKPPGLTLYHWLFICMSSNAKSAALLAGVCIAFLTALSVPLTFWMMRTLQASTQASWEAASFVALSPGLILIFPEFDQTFTLFTCLLIGTWSLAVRGRGARDACLFGIVLAVTLFFTFNILVIGAFLVGYAILHRPAIGIRRLVVISIIALITVAAVYSATGLATGYNPVTTFVQAIHMQHVNLQSLPRPWPQTIGWDLNEFALTTGWLGYGVLGAACIRVSRSRVWRAVIGIVVLQLLITAISGLLQAEAARLWLFLVPVLSIAVGLEVEHWTRREREIFHICRVILLLAVCQKMQFIIV